MRIFVSDGKTQNLRLFFVRKQVQHVQLRTDRGKFKIHDHNNENPLGLVIFEESQKSSGSAMVADKTVNVDGAATQMMQSASKIDSGIKGPRRTRETACKEHFWDKISHATSCATKIDDGIGSRQQTLPDCVNSRRMARRETRAQSRKAKLRKNGQFPQ